MDSEKDHSKRKRFSALLSRFKSTKSSAKSTTTSITSTSEKHDSGAAPVNPTVSYNAVPEKPRGLPSIFEAVRDRNVDQIREVLQARPYDLYLTDDRMSPINSRIPS
jgi:hypothetical protein